MTTKLISINEYRKNLSKLWKKAQKEKIRYIVLVHSKPVFEVNPVSDSEILEVEPDIVELEAIKKYEEDKKNWKLDLVELDFEKIKNEKDFISFLQK